MEQVEKKITPIIQTLSKKGYKMKVSITYMFAALLAVSLVLGVLSDPIESSAVRSDMTMNERQRDQEEPLESAIDTLKLVSLLVNTQINELLAQQDSESVKFGVNKNVMDGILNRNTRLLNKRMKSVALGFGRK